MIESRKDGTTKNTKEDLSAFHQLKMLFFVCFVLFV